MTAFDRGLRFSTLAGIALASACLASQSLKSLDSESRDFLSKVRYIITKQERLHFLAVPAANRKALIEEFWKKRDPTPDSEVNEFRDQYFARIAEANHLFTEAAEPGWLQDRGRVYILLGPPTNRHAYPRGMTFYDVPREIWYYGFFPIAFIDEAWNGNYKLDPLSVEQLSIINRAQKEWQPQVAVEREPIDFEVTAKRAEDGGTLVEVMIPYRGVWFAVRGETLRVTFVVTLEVLEMDGTEIRQVRTESTLETTEEELRGAHSKIHTIGIPVETPGRDCWLRLTLENANDGSKAYKRVKLSG
jgi:GWxTD domain-containing protein